MYSGRLHPFDKKSFTGEYSLYIAYREPHVHAQAPRALDQIRVAFHAIPSLARLCRTADSESDDLLGAIGSHASAAPNRRIASAHRQRKQRLPTAWGSAPLDGPPVRQFGFLPETPVGRHPAMAPTRAGRPTESPRTAGCRPAPPRDHMTSQCFGNTQSVACPPPRGDAVGVPVDALPHGGSASGGRCLPAVHNVHRPAQ